MPFALALAVIVSALGWVLWWRSRRAVRAEFVRSYTFPPGLFDRLRKKHPQLSLKDCQLVAQGLRQFFLCYLKSGCRFVAMPSQGVDDLWHEFILYTRHYDAFSRQAFGRFLHHTPAIALSKNRQDNTGLRRVWWYACREENVEPRHPTRLPLLFAIDAKLAIAGGFVYAPNCKVLREKTSDGAAVHCAGEFSDSSLDGSTDGLGDSTADASGDGGSDGGCGGGGCGGGGD
jgi:hypothetical protein